MTVHDFPVVNASLNAASGALLLGGMIMIKSGRFRAHAAFMIAAVCTSTAFLTCYVIYHIKTGTHSSGLPAGWLRTSYRTMLLTHVVLAIAMLPMILITLNRAAHRRWLLHRRLARPTWAIWMYVSVTGVIVYWMLYHVFPTMRGHA